MTPPTATGSAVTNFILAELLANAGSDVPAAMQTLPKALARGGQPNADDDGDGDNDLVNHLDHIANNTCKMHATAHEQKAAAANRKEHI